MHSLFLTLARIMAALGGIVLVAIILLTCLSVLGRGGNTFLHWDVIETALPGLSARLLDAGVGPVSGDYELVESGMAFAIFAFLPLCQIAGAHATVDIFTARLPLRLSLALTALWEVVFAVVLIVIAWKLYDGMAGKMRYGETTFILQYPVWWSYAASLAAAALAAVVGVWMALVRLRAVATGRAPEAREAGA